MIISIFVPSKEVLFQMLIAKNATYENLDKATTNITEVVDYIFEKFDQLDNNEKVKEEAN